MNCARLLPAAALGLLAATAPALAHPGAGVAHDLAHGFWHPLTGPDHVLAMVAVGLLAVHLGGRALWLAPATFVTVMAAAGAISMSGLTIPYVETGVALSVLTLGLMLMARFSPPVGVATALVGFFAVFHGYAHGLETPVVGSNFVYACGFLAATAMLHAAGIGGGVALGKLGNSLSIPMARVGGGAIAAAGAGLLAGWL